MSEKPRRAAVLCVFVVALAARLTYIALVPPRLTPDSFDYLTLANNIRTHASFSLSTAAPYTPTIRRAPGYSLRDSSRAAAQNDTAVNAQNPAASIAS